MNKKQDFVEIKAIITKESYKQFFKKLDREIDPSWIFDLMNDKFDVKTVEVHEAHFQKYPACETLTVSGNGSIVSEKGWKSSKII